MVVVPLTLGQMALVVDAVPEDAPPPLVGLVAMPAMDPVLVLGLVLGLVLAPVPVPVPVVAGAVAFVPLVAGGEAASVSDVAASTRTAAVATEAPPTHHMRAAAPVVPHRSRTRRTRSIMSPSSFSLLRSVNRTCQQAVRRMLGNCVSGWPVFYS
jgi:hypothetical protein